MRLKKWIAALLLISVLASILPVGLASKYKDYSNDTVFNINGKEIYANLVGSAGSGNCWKWSRNLYYIIWGTRFNEKFEGTSSTGYNLLYRLNDGQRKLTPEHLKAFVTRTQPGATIRVCGCTTSCPQFNNDGLRCGHNGHSLVIVGKDDNGLYTMDDTGAQHTRYYTWSQFSSSWKNFPYIKYIKWPNAPTIAPSEIPESANEEAYSGTFRIKFAASNGVGVYSTPSIGTVSGTLKYPASFTATKKTTTTTAGYYWLYGTSSTGLSGWIALDEASVVSADKYVDVSGVTLDQKSLRLNEGGTASLKATVSPSNATESALSWSSGNTSVATVNDGGVAAVAPGSAVITASALDGSVKATCAVYVTRSMTTKALSKTGSNGTVKLAPGEQLQLSPTFATSKGWTVKSAKSSKSKVATINAQGIVTAKASGTATITIKTKNNKKATLKIKVVDPYAPTKIKLNKSKTVKLKVGATLQLYTALTPSTAVTTLTWASSNGRVATVDQNGKVVALKTGSATIAVKTANGKIAKVKVKVVK